MEELLSSNKFNQFSNTKPVVISPNGGENFTIGEGNSIPITWTEVNLSNNEGINLVLVENSGEFVAETLILGGVNNSYDWPIISQPVLYETPGQYKIKVQVCTIASQYEATCEEVITEDTSDSLFTINWSKTLNIK